MRHDGGLSTRICRIWFGSTHRGSVELGRPLFDIVARPGVLAVSCDDGHRFSKPTRTVVNLIGSIGIEGDAHAGRYVKHRYLAKQNARLRNNRQVHLLEAEIFDELAALGFDVGPGDLGENITTLGINLVALPLGTRLHLGRSAIVELTGVRTPCGYLDRFSKGLRRAMIVKTQRGVKYRAGVLGTAYAGGPIAAGDPISVELPPEPRRTLPAL